MNQAPTVATDGLTIHWPEPAHLRLDSNAGEAEPCEIEFDDGTVEKGELLRFTGRDEHMVFRPHPGHPRYPSKIVVRNARIKRLRLLQPVGTHPVDVSQLGTVDGLLSTSDVRVYNVEFTDGEIESGDTSGFVRNEIGLFLYFVRPEERLERIFIPESAIGYFQVGEPIGRVLVEENAVSEEQLQAAVEKQDQMRKRVLGDYLVAEGLITPLQLQEALAHQRTRPNLRLGEALIDLGAVEPEALQAALSRQRANRGRPLGQILIDMGVVDADTLNKIHAKKLGHHFVSLANFKVSDDAIRVVAPEVARRLRIVPLSAESGNLVVAAESVLDTSAINELTRLSGMRVMQVLAPGQQIEARRAEAYGKAPDEVLSDASAIHFEGMSPVAGDATADAASLPAGDSFDEATPGFSDPHLLEAVERVLKAVEPGDTLDIHIESAEGRRTTHIRFQRATRPR